MTLKHNERVEVYRRYEYLHRKDVEEGLTPAEEREFMTLGETIDGLDYDEERENSCQQD